MPDTDQIATTRVAAYPVAAYALIVGICVVLPSRNTLSDFRGVWGKFIALEKTSKWMCGHRPRWAPGKIVVNVASPEASVLYLPRRKFSSVTPDEDRE